MCECVCVCVCVCVYAHMTSVFLCAHCTICVHVYVSLYV